MLITPSVNSHLIERAYVLWEATENQESLDQAQIRIIDNLFIELKRLNPWTSWIFSLVDFFNPFWMKRKVERALNAYKYDLFLTGKTDQKLHFFSEKERWFMDQKISGIFKNLLSKKRFLNLKQRGYRWQQKVNKYWGKTEYMIGIYLLFIVSKKFPNVKNSIDWVKILNLGLLEKKCVECFEDLNDDALARGLTLFAALPFDEKKGVFRIFVDLSYCVTKEEAKLLIETLWTQVKDKTHSVSQAALKMFSKSA